MADAEVLQGELTLSAAVVRYEQLRTRAALADPDRPGDDDARPLDRGEALELLALGEVIARKAVTGRQLDVRTARGTGASWADIGRALGSTRQSAWEAHQRWIDVQERHHGAPGQLGFDEGDAVAARALAGDADG
jgi:hypothetical protein